MKSKTTKRSTVKVAQPQAPKRWTDEELMKPENRSRDQNGREIRIGCIIFPEGAENTARVVRIEHGIITAIEHDPDRPFSRNHLARENYNVTVLDDPADDEEQPMPAEPGVLSLPKIAELSSLIASLSPLARRVHELFLEADGTMSPDDCLRSLLEKADTSVMCSLSGLCETHGDLIDTYSFGSTDSREWLSEPWPICA